MVTPANRTSGYSDESNTPHLKIYNPTGSGSSSSDPIGTLESFGGEKIKKTSDGDHAAALTSLIELIEERDSKAVVELQNALQKSLIDKIETAKKNEELEKKNINLKSAVLNLHSVLEKTSTRHRATFGSVLATLIFTLSLLVNLLFGSIEIRTSASIIALVISILFFVMARMLPTIEPLNSDD